MYGRGHFGLTLFFSSIIALKTGFSEATLVFTVVSSFLAGLPDIDLTFQKLGASHHRGITHSLFFAILIGAIIGLMFYQTYSTVRWFLIGFSTGTFSVISHLIGDLLTYTTFKPFWPFSKREISLGICAANNVFVNEGFLVAGLFMFSYLLLTSYFGV